MTYYPRKRPLSPRQQKFVEQFLITGIGRQAALRAGYSPGNAGSAAWRLKRHPNVAKAIRIGRSSEARRAQVERDRVLLELVRVAFSDIGEVLDWTSGDDITLRPKDQISPHHRAAIAELAPRRYGKGPRIKFHNKAQALEAIARHLGLFDKQPPVIDMTARRRDDRDARTILLERLRRLKRPDIAADSLAAGAPLAIPTWETPSPSVAPAQAEAQGPKVATSAVDSRLRGNDEDEQGASSSSPSPASPPPIPSPTRAEG